MGVNVTHVGALATDGFNLADFQQLVGRCTGRGLSGSVTALMRQVDFNNIKVLSEFTIAAIAASMAGKDFMDCEELAQTQFHGLLNMMRPFNKKKVLKSMPLNAHRLKVNQASAERSESAKTVLQATPGAGSQQQVRVTKRARDQNIAGPSGDDIIRKIGSRGHSTNPSTIANHYLMALHRTSSAGQVPITEAAVLALESSIALSNSKHRNKGKNIVKSKGFVSEDTAGRLTITSDGMSQVLRIQERMSPTQT
jgi:hypothetical protein